MKSNLCKAKVFMLQYKIITKGKNIMTNDTEIGIITNTSWSRKAKAVLCIETGKTYKSASEAAKEIGSHGSAITCVCKGNRKTVKGKHFCYAESEKTSVVASVSETEKKIPIHKETTIRGKGKRSNGNCHAIFDITTGDIYTSCTDAAEGIGIVQSAISAACKGVVKTVRGHKICKVDKLDEYIPEISEAISKAKDEIAEAKAKLVYM